MKNVAILLSGRGSNFLALSDAIEARKIPARIVLVISNTQNAPGLKYAKDRNYKTLYLPSAGLTREAYDRSILRELQATEVDIICLAGFMRILSPWFIRQYRFHILNIHPSLLPAFPGLHVQQRVLEWGVKVAGCTVHFVDKEVDHGPIVLQHSVPVLENDTEKTLAARILVHEHEIYPEALKLLCEDRVHVQDRVVSILPEGHRR